MQVVRGVTIDSNATQITFILNIQSELGVQIAKSPEGFNDES